MGASIRSQIERLRAEFQTRPAGLTKHVERVLAEALDLAAAFDADPERIELAAWGHDLFRASKPGELVAMARESGLTIEPADEAEPVLLHGPVAAAVIEARFGVDDREALAAIRDHTLGLAEMPLLAKIILIADKVEPHKRQRAPVMKAIRRLARHDLDLALLCWADWKWVEERTHGWQAHPRHWLARERWVAEHHLDVGMPLRGEDFDLAAIEAIAYPPVHRPRRLPPGPDGLAE